MRPEFKRRRRPVFAIPALLAAVTLLGLVSGLLGEGMADGLSWLALGACLVIIAWQIVRRR